MTKLLTAFVLVLLCVGPTVAQTAVVTRNVNQPFLVWVWIGLGWVAALLVVYLRVLRGS